MSLGLEKGRSSELIGLGGEHDWQLLHTCPIGQSASIATADRNGLDATYQHASNIRTMRKVHEGILFQMTPDAVSSQHAAKNLMQEEVDIDNIEALVHPHGPALVNLYFRIIHPSFPILHKEVFIEKYNRTYREIVPHLLAAVYALAVRWWAYDADLLLEEKVDEDALVRIASQSVQTAMHHPRLNTIQAGLLLLQRGRDASSADNSWTWSFTASLIGLGQHLGLHLDCIAWAIPDWEKGLRRRLAWALFIQDSFSAMVFGRPCLISMRDWAVAPLQTCDFSENSPDEVAGRDGGGSSSIENGKLLFMELAKLSTITARVLQQLYSVQALATVTEPQQVLALGKPLGNDLADLLKNLPPNLNIENLQQGRLCLSGFFHFALQATTAVLDRRMLWAIQRSPAGVDSQFAQIFRTALRQRAYNLVQLVSQLQPEHMEAFWFFAAGSCGVILGCFLALLRVTSTTLEESDELKGLMNEFEWQLRIKVRMGKWVLYTLARLKTLGWDEWKALEPDFDAIPGDRQRLGALQSNAVDTGDPAHSLLSAKNNESSSVPLQENNSATWLTEELEDLEIPWDLGGT
ncbi:fungal specific transcription factor domain-containing protein [Aspergillus luchuensis]|uniref:Nitrogen regulatory protein OTam n=1 Tax=Aspergillus kawachii TaxID=1069201 RepID=A0A146FPI8_ASPKA|nr:uncharacterized protein AKAW2_80573A [Aspergillus luchuensis]BCS04772.1 hypothetical protein AKAW2_80573A [Aspergillus luchuensis]BCS16341.1 hypothetical protein ALUC_80548A [Aspergillus luchuensis]GAA93296.1 nitrogen regulatory protein OTam [Aspergillus luchuensis IFO 4308]GAT27645.1 nitrogen regulatory protein OTam [Aspergillus luchuensis]